MKQKTKEIFMHPLKKEIIHYLKKNKGAFYGDMVMDFNYPKYTVLQHIIELKEAGMVTKEKDGGKFNLV